MRTSKRTPKLWWEYLDWSQMQKTFFVVPKSLQEKILESGYWSKGRGKFILERKEV